MDSSAVHNKMTWEEAYIYCNSFTGRLLEIHTEEHLEFINMVQGNGYLNVSLVIELAYFQNMI